MTVKFTCHECELTDAEVQVRERGPVERLQYWMRAVQEAVQNEHQRRRPGCPSRKVDLKIHVPSEGKPVGRL